MHLSRHQFLASSQLRNKLRVSLSNQEKKYSESSSLLCIFLVAHSWGTGSDRFFGTLTAGVGKNAKMVTSRINLLNIWATIGLPIISSSNYYVFLVCEGNVSFRVNSSGQTIWQKKFGILILRPTDSPVTRSCPSALRVLRSSGKESDWQRRNLSHLIYFVPSVLENMW